MVFDQLFSTSTVTMWNPFTKSSTFVLYYCSVVALWPLFGGGRVLALELQTEDPLGGLPMRGVESLFLNLGSGRGHSLWDDGGNFSAHQVEARSGRMKRDMFYFPKGSKLTFQFKLVTPLYTDGTTSYSTDLRLEVAFKLPNAPTKSYGRRRRSVTDDRAALYRTLIAAMDKAGAEGRTCLLRSVCEAAERPLVEYGLLGELLNLLLTPGHLDRVVGVVHDTPHPNATVGALRTPGGGGEEEQDEGPGDEDTGNEDGVDAEEENEGIRGGLSKKSASSAEANTINEIGRDKVSKKKNPWAKSKKLLAHLKKVEKKAKLKEEKMSKEDDKQTKIRPEPDIRDVKSIALQEVRSYSSDYYSMSDFIQAEEYGRNFGGCWAAYPDCTLSMREIVYDAIATLSQNNHLLIHDEL